MTRGVMRMLDVPVSSPTGRCRICGVPEAFDALYEFARAKELLETTDINYSEFISQYLRVVFGPVMTRTRVDQCLRNHIRPSLRREAMIYEIDAARREGRAPTERDIDDFCLGRWSPLSLRVGRPLGDRSEGSLDDPNGVVDPFTKEEWSTYSIADVVERLYPDGDTEGVTLYRLTYWNRADLNDRSNEK